MRILVTNDDGIHGPGLVTLEKIAAEFTDEVWTVAPETDQSGSAHSLTLSDPLRLREVGERRYALRGTPTDCVIMAVRHVMPSPPDLVLSGVNRGQNVADDIGYSGTVAGAMEGTVLGIRSIALSQAIGPESRQNPHYATAEALAPRIIRELLAETWPSGILYNLNFPAVPAERVTGFEVTVQGKRDQQFLAIDGRIDGRGMPYYWIAYSASRFETPLGTDIRAVAEGRVSVTPLRLDLTAHDLVGRLANRFGGRAVGL